MDKMTNEELVESVIGIAESFYLDAPDDCADAQKSLAEIKRYKTELLSRLTKGQRAKDDVKSYNEVVDSLQKEIKRLDNEVEQLIIDNLALRSNKRTDVIEGQRAIEALEKIEKLNIVTNEDSDVLMAADILADWRKGNEHDQSK